MEYTININTPDIPQETKISFNIAKSKIKYPKVSDFIQILESMYDHKFEYFDTQTWNTPQWTSYLIDLVLEYKSGKQVDLCDWKNNFLKEFDFTREEIKMFNTLRIEERLWAILILLNNPAHSEFKNIYND